MVAARVFVVAALAHLCSGAYVLKDDYGSDMSFFDHFSFFTVSCCGIALSGGLYSNPDPG